ncbi:MAG: acyl-CoA dehydrogenase [Deltaproteobacteria bacterium]|nr:MAG: acyl-CoA dehydrogenase [Deltaproteobacteria bacterium]RLA97904.1 MAG: acyl-CoA dehydrogenase [Deltaproteobacteria bacterium]
MDFGFTEEEKMLQETARDFARNEIAPTVEKDEKEHLYRREIVKKMADLGFFGCIAPEKYGGNGMGHLAATIITMEIAKESPSYGVSFNLQMNAIQSVLLEFGTEEQREKWIPPLISADLLGCFALTEPDTGSDVASMKTTAREVEDGFIINGSKMWISGVPVADVGIVFAMTDREKRHRGMSAFIVDMHSPGIEQKAIEEKLGLYSSPTGEITFDEVKVPKDALVGEKGDGFKIAMFMLDRTRLSCAARAAGVAEKCFELAAQYANERIQFGVPIIQHQMIQEQLARMWCEHEAAKLLVFKAAWLLDHLEPGQRPTLAVSTAKYYTAEAAVMAANEAMKIYASYGFSTEYPIERYYRDAKSYQSVEGTSNIQKMIIARHFIEKRG